MSEPVNAAADLTSSRVADLISRLEPGGPEVEAAQVALRRALSEGSHEASVEEIGDAIDRGLHPGVAAGIGAAGLVALVGGLRALRRRGGEQGEEAERWMNDSSISRREMLAVMAMGGAGLGLGEPILRTSLVESTDEQSALSGFNVLAIVIDDLNDYPTFMGGAEMAVATPNLDALAASSQTYLNHHVTVPVCPPSRATLMWGFDVSRHRMTGTTIDPAEYRDFSDQWADETLVSHARRAGVATYGGGKVFHADQHVDQWTQFVSNDWPTATDGSTFGFDHGPLLDDRNPDDEMTSELIRILRSHDGRRPFLMMPGLRLPHLPWRVPQSYLDLYPIDDIVLPDTPENDWDDLGPIATAQLEKYQSVWGAGWFEVVESEFGRRQLMQAYLASMSHTDAMVGRLLDALADSPHADDTVVILVSDNGYHQGENFAYRKLTLRSQATRTPFIVRGVDGAPFAPGMIERPVSSTLFAPTVLDVLGVNRPALMAAPSLRGSPRSSVAMSHVANSVSLAYAADGLGAGRWTLHFAPGQEFDAATVTPTEVAEMELYDHLVDPGEFDNLLS